LESSRVAHGNVSERIAARAKATDDVTIPTTIVCCLTLSKPERRDSFLLFLFFDVTCKFTVQSMDQTPAKYAGGKHSHYIMKKLLLVLALVVASSALFVSQAQAGQGKGHKHHKGHHAHHQHGKHHKA
jgi:hypothetical protein